MSLFPLTLENLCFKKGQLSILNNITTRIDNPGITVLMGPNGAGKSLLLRCLHGMIEPTTGSVLWNGKTPDTAIRRRQSLVFQRPILLRRSVRANIEFVLRRRKLPAQEKVWRQLLEQVGLEGLEQRPARQLSGGEQQRLAVARALALKPEVLMMDEPTASLDPASTAIIESIVIRLREQGTKILYVTHDIGQARRLADEILFLHGGCLLEHSPANNFFKQQETEEARRYLAGQIVF